MPTLQPTVSACWSYLPEDKEVKATIIIAPIRIDDRQGRYMVYWACSRRHSCKDYRCLYSRGSEVYEEVAEEIPVSTE